MKKKLIILLLCIGSVMLPSLVHADMGAPEIISYDVIVTNKEGAKTNDENIVIPYDTVCTVNYETMADGKLELEADCKGYNDTLFILGDDVRVLKDEYQPTKEDKLSKPIKYYIYKDIEMYSGPSYKYKKIGQTIPAGSKVTVNFSDKSGVWSYAEYNAKKGWFYTYWYDVNNQIARVIENDSDKKLITVRNITKLYKYPNDAATLDAKEKSKKNNDFIQVSIPAGTNLTAIYYYPILKEDGLFYINYNGVSGWVDSAEGVAIYSKGSVLVLRPQDIKVYDEKFKSVKLDINKYQEFTYNYKAFFYEKEKDTLVYAITYNKKNYFCEVKFKSEDDSSDNEVLVEANPSRIEVINNAPIYETYEGQKEIGTVNKGEKMDREYFKYYKENDSHMFYIKTAHVAGWIKQKYINSVEYKEGEEMSNIISAPFKTTSPATTESSKTSTTKIANSNDMSTKEIITICVIGAIVLALVVVVIIVLINRKKKMKNVVYEENNNKMSLDNQQIKDSVETSESVDNTDENASLK